jgi:predicted ATPase
LQYLSAPELRRTILGAMNKSEALNGFLRERWTQAQTGEGQVVLLSGEAGIGKSRLVQELKDQTSQDGATRIAFQCLP